MTGLRSVKRLTSIQEWRQLLNDTNVLFVAPKKHHRGLLHHEYALRDTHAVDSGTLANMLELADEALMYAHSLQADQQWLNTHPGEMALCGIARAKMCSSGCVGYSVQVTSESPLVS